MLGFGFYPPMLRRRVAAGSLLDFDFITSQLLPPAVTFSRTTNGSRFNSAGLLVHDGPNVARFDYDPATLNPLGLLIEPQRTNLVLFSEALDNAAWTKVNVTVTADAAVSPDGTQSLDSITADAVSTGKYVRIDRSVTQGQAYSLSFTAKKTPGFIQTSTNTGIIDTAYSSIDTDTGAVANNSINTTAVDTGAFWRISWNAVSITGGAVGLLFHLADSLSNGRQAAAIAIGPQYLWGFQLEDGAFPTSYIPTTTAAATRTSDVATTTLPQSADILVQDREGGAWITGVAAGPYTLAPRANKRHISRLRAYPAGYAASHPELAVAYP